MLEESRAYSSEGHVQRCSECGERWLIANLCLMVSPTTAKGKKQFYVGKLCPCEWAAISVGSLLAIRTLYVQTLHRTQSPDRVGYAGTYRPAPSRRRSLALRGYKRGGGGAFNG